MRLLKVDIRGEVSLTTDLVKGFPPYAILSHTWGAEIDEVNFNDLQSGSSKSKVGYAKIRFCGEQARKNGLQHIWVDTCCINKANNTELSEALNSMFRWYRNAAKCYVYLSDVSTHKRDNNGQSGCIWGSALRNSRWFTRGWTLQELLAPESVEFFSREGEYLGDKKSLEGLIHEVTNIPIAALCGAPLADFSTDERLRWAWNRKTERDEDQAYCLLGIFNVFISPIYGEGDNAYIRLREEINRSTRSKLDLDKVPYAKGATFNAYDLDHTTCHTATRIDLLAQIQDWAQNPCSKSIFWLNGMAGTGKSTISWTVAEWLDDQGREGTIGLGASFFFKRDEGDRGSASRFFPTIIRQLVLKIPGMDNLLADVITSDPSIFDKALGEQFDQLIYRPLQKIKATTSNSRILVVVVDALDECEKERDIKTIIDLWSRLPEITSVRLKLFLTSRPDLPIQLGFRNMSTTAHRDVILQDEVPQTTIQHDIFVFLKDKFETIREKNRLDPLLGKALDQDWPGDKILHALVDMAVPLFIVAATICRFVDDANWDPQERLESILRFPGIGEMEQMEQTYLPVLTQMSATLTNSHDTDRLYQEFRVIVGSIVTLAEPLSIMSLGSLLKLRPEAIALRLRPLHSVLRVTSDTETPIRTLHLSFSEFLLSDKLRNTPFGIDGPATHRLLFTKCLGLLSGPDGLRENICNLEYPGQLRREVNLTTIDSRLPPVLQYACRYWVHHAQGSNVQICDENEVHTFLRAHFLHWLEALSLMNRIAEVIEQVRVLKSLLSLSDSSELSLFLEDARRVVLSSRYIVDLAPLQIYSSAIIFAPQTSVVRKTCGEKPSWVQRFPITPATWGLELQKLEGHTGWVSAVAFSPDGSLLASGSGDQTVRVWDPSTGREVQKLEGHTGWVIAVAFSPDGSLLASRSVDQTVRLWDPSTGREVQKLEGHTDWVSAVAFSPDGSLLASGSGDQTVRLWDPSTGREVQKLEGHTNEVSAVAFSPDGSLLASGSDDQTVRLWDPSTGREVQKLEGHTSEVIAVAFSPDGSLLASGSEDQTVRLWDPSTGREVQKLEGHTSEVIAVAFSPDGSLLASGSDDETVRLWDPSTGREVQKLEGHTTEVSAVAFSPDGSLLASGSDDQTVRLWDPSTGREVQKLEGHTSDVIAVAFSPDGSLLASGSGDQTVRLWDPSTGREVQKLEGHTSRVWAVAFSPDGSLLASGSRDQTVRLWDPSTGREVQKLEGHTSRVWAVAFSPDGSLLASGSGDQTVRLWDPSTSREVQKLEGHTSDVRAVAFSPDGSLLASGSDDQTVRLWDPSTGREVQKLEGHTSDVRAVAFSPDGSLLASGSEDQTVRLWDPSTGREVQKLEGHTGWVSAVAFSPDGSLLASGSGDQTVRLWDPSTGREVQKFKQNQLIKSISFSIDNKILFADGRAIRIENEFVSGNHYTPATIHNVPMIGTVTMNHSWAQQGLRNLLWLPHEYRGNCNDVHGNTLAIGQYSGNVSFVQLDYR